MALTRKFLTAMGIEAEKIDEIITAHTESLDGVKEERDKYKADVEKYKADAEKLPSVQKELDDLKAATDGKESPFKSEYEKTKSEYDKLKSEYSEYKQGVEAEKKKAEHTEAYKKLLLDAGVSDKRIAAVLKLSGEAIDKLEFDEKGGVKDADKLKDGIKSEWADFIVTKETNGAQTATPPTGNAGQGTQPSRAAQLAAQYNAEHYGSAKKEG